MAVTLKLIAKKQLATVIVESTVMPKAIAHLTDSKMLETARSKLVEAAKGAGIELKQTFAKEGHHLKFNAACYAHAKQFRRMLKAIKRQHTIVVRLRREIQHKATQLSLVIRQALGEPLDKSGRILQQSVDKNRRHDTTATLYSWHAPEVQCINKGNSRTPYEFGANVGIALTLRSNLIEGARSFEGNPYDGHTLHEQIEQSSILMQDTNIKPTSAYVDPGYRGVEQENPELGIKHRGKKFRLTEQVIKLLARHQAVEPIIGHLKQDRHMGRRHLKGEEGDRLHAVLCAAGYNIRCLLRMIAKKGLGPLLRLIGMTAKSPIQRWLCTLRIAVAPAPTLAASRLW